MDEEQGKHETLSAHFYEKFIFLCHFKIVKGMKQFFSTSTGSFGNMTHSREKPEWFLVPPGNSSLLNYCQCELPYCLLLLIYCHYVYLMYAIYWIEPVILKSWPWPELSIHKECNFSMALNVLVWNIHLEWTYPVRFEPVLVWFVKKNWANTNSLIRNRM